MTVRYINPSELQQSPAYSQAVVVERQGRTVYVGGQNGVDASGALAEGFAAQTARAVENVRLALAAAGAGFADVISWTVSVVDGEDVRAGYAAMGPALQGRDAPPIVSVFRVSGLALPGALVELSVIAVVG